MVLFSIPLLLIDLGDVQVIEYRAKIYQQGRYYIAAFMALFTICSGILGFLTINVIKRKKMKVSEMSPGLQKKNLILDVKRKENCLSLKKNRLIKNFPLVNIPGINFFFHAKNKPTIICYGSILCIIYIMYAQRVMTHAITSKKTDGS